MKSNEIVAYGLSGLIVVLVIIDIFSPLNAEPEHYTVIAGLIATFLGLHQGVSNEPPRTPREPQTNRRKQP